MIDLLFHMTQLTASKQKQCKNIMQSFNQLSAVIRTNENTMAKEMISVNINEDCHYVT